MSEYLSKEEIKKWRSSVEKITLEEYAARLGKKLQEEKKTNDLADMLYTHYNPTQMPSDYDTVTKLEKIDLTPKTTHTKPKKQSSKILPELDDLDIDEDNLAFEENDIENIEEEEEIIKEKPIKKEVKKEKVVNKAEITEEKPKKKEAKKETIAEEPKEKPSKDKPTKETKKAQKVEKTEKPVAKKEKTTNKKADKSETNNFDRLNITFKKPLTEREEKVLAYFIEKKGEIVFAKDLAELLDLKRDYIYKYIKNLRAKMSTDIIANADNGGFLLN